ncbi:MAG: cation:proton antiporter, partial [Planctomycetota bacterium]
MEEQLGHLVVVVVLGISAQWISWRLNLPSILLLLLFGIVAGPVLGLLHPDRLLGPLLLPVVLLSVALILYEGGLSLRLRELRQVGSVVRNLVTLGTLVTGLGGALAAYLLFDLAAPLAALVGAIFVVTGPTVVGPLLRHVRPSGAVGPILKWEGIVTDPLGAMLAVLIFEILVDDRMHQAPMLTLFGVLKTLLLGGAVGAAGAWLLWHLLRRHLVPDFLQNPLSLMLVLMVFTVGMLLESEAGLVGVTLMGVLLANQRSAPIRHIIEFKENLRVLLISTIFILLAARLEVEHLKALGWRHFAFLGALVLVVRPLTVFLSTWRTGLTLREKAFLSSVAPRGIVAAAVSAVLGLELSQRGYDGAELLVPLTFLVIIGTVLFYGIIATPVARKLGLSEPARQGYLILGAHPWARALGRVFQEQGIPLLLVDSNRQNVSEAHLAGLP